MAKFQKSEIVWYNDGELKRNLAVILEVAQEDPAQYVIALTADSSQTTCGEGENEPGAVFSL